MAERPTPTRRRATALLAGAVALTTLGTVLLIWITSTEAAARAPFGSTGSVATVVVALVVVAAGMVLVRAEPAMPSAARWSAALVVALANGVVGVLAIVTVLGPEEPADLGIGLLLGVALMATNVLAGQVARRPSA